MSGASPQKAQRLTAAELGRVAVLMGGTSSEREVSLSSGRNVLQALQARGVDAHAVDGIPSLRDALIDKRFDRVFNILHGGDGENGVLQGMLESFGVPYTGSGVLGSALSLDKIRTKQVWLSEGLPTPRFRVLEPGDDVRAAAAEIGLPVVIKPACEGSSVGISRVFDDAGLEDGVALAARYGGQMLVEELIVGGEFTVAVLGDIALPSIRIVPAGEYYDYHAKYVADDTVYLCPGLEGDEEQALRALAHAAFKAAACGGWARVDIMRTLDGRNYLLEVNTAPGMTTHSLVPKAAAALGIDFEELVWRILVQTTTPRNGAARGGSA